MFVRTVRLPLHQRQVGTPTCAVQPKNSKSASKELEDKVATDENVGALKLAKKPRNAKAKQAPQEQDEKGETASMSTVKPLAVPAEASGGSPTSSALPSALPSYGEVMYIAMRTWSNLEAKKGPLKVKVKVVRMDPKLRWLLPAKTPPAPSFVTIAAPVAIEVPAMGSKSSTEEPTAEQPEADKSQPNDEAGAFLSARASTPVPTQRQAQRALNPKPLSTSADKEPTKSAKSPTTDNVMPNASSQPPPTQQSKKQKRTEKALVQHQSLQPLAQEAAVLLEPAPPSPNARATRMPSSPGRVRRRRRSSRRRRRGTRTG